MSRTVVILEGDQVLELLAKELARDANASGVAWLYPSRSYSPSSVNWTPENGLRALRRALSRAQGTRVRVEWVDAPWGQVRASWGITR